MVVSAPDYVKSRYELKNLKPLENNVAEQVNREFPSPSPLPPPPPPKSLTAADRVCA
jgi:hypothetical protein